MTEAFYPSNEYDSSDEDYRVDRSPEAVIHSQHLTTDEKRALLSSWASDARAVENVPALRRLDDGSLVEIDAVLAALRRLDGIKEQRKPAPFVRRGGQSYRVARHWPARRHDDDDDDPPTAPVALPLPRPAPLADTSALAPAA